MCSFKKENEERRRLEEEANKNSTDHWLQADWIIDKDETRWKNIITFFLEHFLNMAERSNTFRYDFSVFLFFFIEIKIREECYILCYVR